jgi:tetratricopeptide (TPR) repeat protein
LGRHYAAHPSDGLKNALPHLGKAVGQHPDDAEPRLARGEVYGRLGKFPEAAADYAWGLELSPRAEWAWMHSALLNLVNGDPEAYRDRKRGFLMHYRRSKEAHVIEHLARTFSIDPEVDPFLDAEDIRRLRESVDAVLPNAPDRVRPWLELAKGALAYRAGDFGAAIGSLEASRVHVGLPASEANDDLFLAMAHYRLGHPDVAQKLLTKASGLIDSRFQRSALTTWNHTFTSVSSATSFAPRRAPSWPAPRRPNPTGPPAESNAVTRTSATSRA